MTPEEQTAVSRWQYSLVEKIVGSAVIGLLAWITLTTQSMSLRMVAIETKLSMMAASPYTSEDAAKDQLLNSSARAALSARLNVVERRYGISGASAIDAMEAVR